MDSQKILSAYRSSSSKAEAARKLGMPVSTYKRKLNKLLDHSQVKQSREEDRRISRLKEELTAERKKREQAEHELEEAIKRESLYIDAAPSKLEYATKKRGRATAIFCCTDWHSEENIEPDTICDINEFNLDICSARINQAWDKFSYLLEFSRHVADIKEGTLWLGGDLINGVIHEELLEGNFLGPAEAVVFVQDHVATGIEHLKKDVDHLRVVCNRGNHGRSGKRKVSVDYRSSWEYLCYQNLARYYRNDPKVSWNICKGYMAIEDIQGHKVRFHHGDNIKYGGGVGGITIPVNKAINEWNKTIRADYDIFGHFHQYIDNYRWTCCGCLVGYNAYAMSIKAECQEPSQNFIVIDRKHGKTMSLPVFVKSEGERHGSLRNL